jgi:exopolysaccharide production protein ExoZ
MQPVIPAIYREMRGSNVSVIEQANLTASLPAATKAKPQQYSRRPPHIWGLDIIRFVAAVMVVLFHLSWKSQDADISFTAGWVGVEIFFVISAFLIMQSASGADAATFATKRFVRLYPAAIVCAVINFLVLIPYSDLASSYGLAVSATPGAFVASILLVKGPFLVGSLWTLPVEIAFYAIIAALIWRGWVSRPARIAAGLILWSGIYLVPFALGQYDLLPFTVGPLGYGLLNLTMLRHGCFFGLGILLWSTTQKRASGGHLALVWLGFALCCVEIAARAAELRPAYGRTVDGATLAIGALATFSIAILGIWLAPRLNGWLQPGAGLQTVMRYIGLATYPLYLMHEGVGGVASSLLQANGYGHGFALLAGLGLSLVASLAVVLFVERWLLPRLRQMARIARAWLIPGLRAQGSA